MCADKNGGFPPSLEPLLWRERYGNPSGRQGEIRDRTTEGQHYRIAGLNLLTAIIVYWTTLHLGHAVEAGRREYLDTPDHLLAQMSPLGWAHILLTGEYLWPKGAAA